MPRNGSGTYSLPAGNPVVAGDLIEATWANNTMSDLGNEITNSLDRNGNGGMLAPFRLADGTLGAPGVAWLNEPSTGFYRAGSGEQWAVVSGQQIAQFTTGGVLIPTGKSLTVTDGINNTSIGATTPSTGAFTTLSATGATNLDAGTVSAPGLYLEGETTSGLYRIGANNHGWAISGAKVLDISSTGLGVTGRVTTTGTVGTPSANAHFGFGATQGAVIAGVGSTYDVQLQNSANQNVLAIPTGTRNVEITGNTTLGDATTDTVTVNGYMGVGGAGDSAYGIKVNPSALTGANQVGIRVQPVGTSAATGYVMGVQTLPQTAAASFTAAAVYGVYATNASKGAGSTITDQHGVYIADQTQGTNNYGITSIVSSGTNKWNIYASGTAANYFAGRVLIGTTTSNTAFAGNLQFEGTSADFSMVRYANATGAGNIYLAHSRGTTVGTNTIVNSGDTLGSIIFSGANGTGYDTAAYISGAVDGTPGASGDMPGRLTFWTTPDGSATPAERMRINSSGSFTLSTAGPHAIGGSTSSTYQWFQTGTYAGARAFGITSTLTLASGDSAYGMLLNPTFTEFSSGTHPIIAGLYIQPAITNGGATTTDAYGTWINTFAAATGTTRATGLYVSTPTGATTNLAVWADGNTRWDSGYLKASSSTAYRSTTNYHELYTDNNTGVQTLVVTNAAATATNQYGVAVFLSGDPNGAGNYFLTCIGNATERATIRANGGLANYSANNVNLSDASVKRDKGATADHTALVKALSYRKFSYLDDQTDSDVDGLMAQDVQALDPTLVTEFSEGKLGIYTHRLQEKINSVIPKLIARIEALEAQLN